MSDTSMELVVPGTGEVLPLSDPETVAGALARVDVLIAALRDARRDITTAAVGLSETLLTKTFHTDGGDLVLSGGEETVYDADEIRAALLDAGVPEPIVETIVVEQPVTYRVDARRAKAAAAANETVKAIIDRHTTKRPKAYTLSLK